MSGSASGLLWTLGLSVLVTLLFALPLLPALIEHRWPQDVAPLSVVREHDGNVANFAHAFGHFIETRFAAILPQLEAAEIIHTRLDNGGSCTLLGKSAAFSLDDSENAALTFKHLLVGAGDVNLPDHVLFESEVFAARDFTGGALSAFRAVLAHGSAALGEDSVVLRWIHACGVLSVYGGTQLFGRASSDSCIELAARVKFERLYAPKILFGLAPDSVPKPDIPTHPLFDWRPAAETEMSSRRWRVKDDVELPPASACTAPLVVLGNLRVGASSWLRFALKSNGDLLLGENCRVDDAVVATGRVEIGSGCRIKGPIISEVEVRLRRGSVVGTLDSPATISAPRIVIETGVIVFGTVWARDAGEVGMDEMKVET